MYELFLSFFKESLKFLPQFATVVRKNGVLLSAALAWAWQVINESTREKEVQDLVKKLINEKLSELKLTGYESFRDNVPAVVYVGENVEMSRLPFISTSLTQSLESETTLNDRVPGFSMSTTEVDWDKYVTYAFWVIIGALCIVAYAYRSELSGWLSDILKQLGMEKLSTFFSEFSNPTDSDIDEYKRAMVLAQHLDLELHYLLDLCKFVQTTKIERVKNGEKLVRKAQEDIKITQQQNRRILGEFHKS